MCIRDSTTTPPTAAHTPTPAATPSPTGATQPTPTPAPAEQTTTPPGNNVDDNYDDGRIPLIVWLLAAAAALTTTHPRTRKLLTRNNTASDPGYHYTAAVTPPTDNTPTNPNPPPTPQQPGADNGGTSQNTAPLQTAPLHPGPYASPGTSGGSAGQGDGSGTGNDIAPTVTPINDGDDDSHAEALNPGSQETDHTGLDDLLGLLITAIATLLLAIGWLVAALLKGLGAIDDLHIQIPGLSGNPDLERALRDTLDRLRRDPEGREKLRQFLRYLTDNLDKIEDPRLREQTRQLLQQLRDALTEPLPDTDQPHPRLPGDHPNPNGPTRPGEQPDPDDSDQPDGPTDPDDRPSPHNPDGPGSPDDGDDTTPEHAPPINPQRPPSTPDRTPPNWWEPTPPPDLDAPPFGQPPEPEGPDNPFPPRIGEKPADPLREALQWLGWLGQIIDQLTDPDSEEPAPPSPDNDEPSPDEPTPHQKLRDEYGVGPAEPPREGDPNYALYLQLKRYQREFWEKYGWTPFGKQIHHAIEQMIWDRYPGIFSPDTKDSGPNTRGIWGSDAPTVHQSAIRQAWNRIYKFLKDRGALPSDPQPMHDPGTQSAREGLLFGAFLIDVLFGDRMIPPPDIITDPAFDDILRSLGMNDSQIEHFGTTNLDDRVDLLRMILDGWTGQLGPYSDYSGIGD